MSKRELGFSNGIAELESPPMKRQKDDGAQDQAASMSDPVVAEGKGDAGGASQNGNETVREQGLELWNVTKNAVNKEGRVLSLDFMRRPSKRQYPDYYRLIQHPIALDEIKQRLENGSYQSLENVKQDLELCFSNAKKYNMKDSDIWKDAKFLHKLVAKEYNKLTGADEHVDVVNDGRETATRDIGDDEGDEGGKRKGKNKPPNMNRLLKSRLQKLVNKTDESGRVLSTEFMELPSKKDWPFYYKEIKRPQCLENIFKHLKRKEYHTCAELAADVELVFSNALAFNQEHTDIWEDALLLRDFFRQLMSDLPEPFSLPEYAKPSHGKIKLKMPPVGNSAPTAPAQAASQLPSSSGSLLLRVPANQTQNKPSAQVQTPTVNSVSLPKRASSPKPQVIPSMSPPAPTQPTLAIPPTTAQANAQPLPYLNMSYSQHYPNASYQPPINPSGASFSATTTPTTNALAGQHASHSNSPAPPQPHYLLKSVYLKTEPRGRPFKLDYRDGVKSWAMRLSHEEKGVCVADIKFLGDEEEESGMEEDQEEQRDEKQEEEEEEEEIEAEAAVKNGKKKGKGRGRGRPKVKAAGKTKGARSVKKTSKPKMDELQVKLNGAMAKENEDPGGEWHLDLPVGSNIIEIGEKGGLVWKVFAERLSDEQL